jgi:hypothetical protein
VYSFHIRSSIKIILFKNNLGFALVPQVRLSASSSLRSIPVSIDNNAYAGDKTPNYAVHLPIYIAFMTTSCL